MPWEVQVIDENGDVIHTVDVDGGERKAEKVEDGMNRNLNHEKYHTLIVEIDK